MNRVCHVIAALLVARIVCLAELEPLTLPVGGLAPDKILDVAGEVALWEADANGNHRSESLDANDSTRVHRD